MLGFAWFYSSDSGLFNRLRRFQAKKSFRPSPHSTLCPARAASITPIRKHSTISDFCNYIHELSVFQLPGAAGGLFAQGRRRERNGCAALEGASLGGCAFAGRGAAERSVAGAASIVHFGVL